MRNLEDNRDNDVEIDVGGQTLLELVEIQDFSEPLMEDLHRRSLYYSRTSPTINTSWNSVIFEGYSHSLSLPIVRALLS